VTRIDGGVRPQPDVTPGDCGVRLQPDVTPSDGGVRLQPDVPAAPAISDRNYDLAAVLAALAERIPASPGQVAGTSTIATSGLREAARALLGSAQAALLERLLLPIDPGAGSEALSARLREQVEAGGVFLEARLRGLLEPGSVMNPLEALPPDIRVLLALVTHRLNARQAGQDQAHGSAEVAEPGPRASESTASREVADRVLDRQLEVVHRWMADRVLAIDLPIQLRDEDATAAVRFRREGGGGTGEGEGRVSVVEVHVHSAAYGPVHAVARWSRGACRSVCFVASERAAAAFSAELETLRSALGNVFHSVVAEVIVDAVRAAGPPPAEVGSLAAGSVVSVRT
jgi:hypothetical protein